MRIERTTLAALAALAALAVLPAPAGAQPSTSRLPDAGRSPWSAELSAGVETPLFDGGIFGSSAGGRGRAATAAVRYVSPDANVGLRAAGWWIGRHVERRDGEHHWELSERLLGVGAAVDLEIPLGRRARLAPSLGAGLVPSARSRSQASGPSPSAPHDEGGSGRMWTFGLALRAGRLVIEQHGIGLLGADHVGGVRREYYPLTVGWRF